MKGKVKLMKTCLLEAVCNWEEENGLSGGDGYLPYFRNAFLISKELGYTPTHSIDGSHFGVCFKPEEIKEIIGRLKK